MTLVTETFLHCWLLACIMLDFKSDTLGFAGGIRLIGSTDKSAISRGRLQLRLLDPGFWGPTQEKSAKSVWSMVCSPDVIDFSPAIVNVSSAGGPRLV